jgi:TolB-like protein
MGSIIKDFEYDLFISYRKNDNIYDGWVTEFVNNLNLELKATIKDNLSTYFDENPFDGLLETNDVEKSINNKIKSILFLPILSKTYCDPKSYAWQHEFLKFNNLASDDSIGRDVVLRNGNVTSRILPVRIHDLDQNDLQLLQEELGGPLRAIDFCFREPGVNRPLKPDDREDRNLNKTSYRNQINKIANTIKEILISIQNPVHIGNLSQVEISSGENMFQRSIAVLPFVNMSNDPDQEYFSDGISDEIINTLVQIRDLKVAGRTSAFSFRNTKEDLRSIGEKLNVSTILEGSVRKSGNRIRITAQLIEASTGFHLWSEKFDRELNDIFIIQDEIAKAIVGKLEVTFSGRNSGPKERVHTNSVEAYQLYLKGMSLFYKRGVYMIEGLKCFEQALQIDPDYALALAGLADSFSMLSLHSYLPPEEAWTKASEAANHAVKFGPGLAEVHTSIATIALLFERNWPKAEKEYLNALELNPSYLQARSWYALFYLHFVKFNDKEALKNARLGVEHDPLSSYAHAIVSGVSSYGGSYGAGIKAASLCLKYDQEFFLGWYLLGIGHHGAGNVPEAISAYKHAINISGRHCWAITSLLSILAEATEYQDLDEANFLYREMLTRDKMGFMAPALLAAAAASLGKNEDAIRYFSLAIARHDPNLIQSLQSRSDCKALQDLPEYREIIKTLL